MNSVKTILLAFGILLSGASGVLAQDMDLDMDTEMVWLFQGNAASDGSFMFAVEDGLALSLENPEITFTVINLRPYAFRAVKIKAKILSEKGDKVLSGKIKQDFLTGETPCLFELEMKALPHGNYSLEFSLETQFTDEDTTYTVALWRGTPGKLLEKLEAAEDRFKKILEKNAARLPALTRARVQIALHFIESRDNAHPETWVSLINYLKSVSDECRATLQEPVETKIAASDIFTLGNGLFNQGDTPVYLAGVALEYPDAAWLERLTQWGLNFVSVKVGPEYTLSPEGRPKAMDEKHRTFFQSAQEKDLGLAVRLSPHQAESVFPNAALSGMTNLAYNDMQQYVEKHLDAMTDLLQGYPNLCAISLAEEPRFIFDGDAIRQGFIEQVELCYPDRQELNQLWHAHIASYDDITIWDQDAPEYSYHYDQPYQYIFQTYHRNLATKYLATWHDRVVVRANKKLPLSVTFSDLAFEVDESRFGADREALSGLLEVSACTSASQSVDERYGMNYPRGMAYYTLMRSLAPEKPLLNLEGSIAFPVGGKATADAAYVRTVLWEGVLSGLNGIALPYDSPVFDRPETLDALVESQQHFNRLGTLLQNFQNTPKTIAILFSTASMIFDNGDPHLNSALKAYEGASFAGYGLRFITEEQCIKGDLKDIKLLLLPETPALTDAAFKAIMEYDEQGGNIARIGTPIPYNAFGHSRYEVLRPTAQTILIRSKNNPTEFLHAMDTAQAKGLLPPIIRSINEHGYPLEGVKTQYLEQDGKHYLYLVNLRKQKVLCHLTGDHHKGIDLISGDSVAFPTVIPPMEPMLLELEEAPPNVERKKSYQVGKLFSGEYISDRISKRRRPNERSISRLSQ